MKTTKNIVAKDTTLHLSPATNEIDSMEIDSKMARPLKSLRPMKSMVRVKSFKPKRIEIAHSRSQSRRNRSF